MTATRVASQRQFVMLRAVSESQWLLRGPEDEEVLILHQGHHIRAKPTNGPWQNRSFESPGEAALAVMLWIEDLTGKGWAVVAEGVAARLESAWSSIARQEGDWLTLTVTSNLLEEGLAGAVASRVAAAPPRVLQLANRAFRHDLAPVTESLAAVAIEGVESLVIDTPEQSVSRQSYFLWGDIGPLLSTMAGLERLFAVGDFEISSLENNSLREITLVGDPLMPGAIDAVAASSCPLLETVIVELARESGADPGADEALEALLVGGLPSLSRLVIEGHEEPAALLEALSAAPGFAALSSVRIAGELEDEDLAVPALLRIADRLTHLDELILGIDVLSEEAMTELGAVLGNLVDDSTLESATLPDAYRAWATPVEDDEDDEEESV